MQTGYPSLRVDRLGVRGVCQPLLHGGTVCYYKKVAVHLVHALFRSKRTAHCVLNLECEKANLHAAVKPNVYTLWSVKRGIVLGLMVS